MYFFSKRTNAILIGSLALSSLPLNGCKQLPVRDDEQNQGQLSATAPQKWPFTFQSSRDGAYGFSWTNAEVRDGMQFIQNGTRDAEAANRQANGIFPSTLTGGYGVYLAQDPFVSTSYGNTLLIVKLRPNISSTMAHSAVTFEGSQFDENFVPAVLSNEKLFHYFWRDGNATVVRKADVVSEVQVIRVNPKFAKFETLPMPSEETLTLKNLPAFVSSFSSKVWYELIAEQVLDKFVDPDPILFWKKVISLENTLGESMWKTEGISEQELNAIQSPENVAKYERYRKLIANYAKERDLGWKNEWPETTTDPRIRCTTMKFQTEAREPIVGFSYEDMNSPRNVTFRVSPEETRNQNITVTPDFSKRRGDVTWVKLSTGQEGFVSLIQLRCSDTGQAN